MDELEKVRISEQVQREIANSATVKVLLDRLEDDYNAAVLAFASASPADIQKLQDLQLRVWRAVKCKEWIRAAIDRGETAKKNILDQPDEED